MRNSFLSAHRRASRALVLGTAVLAMVAPMTSANASTWEMNRRLHDSRITESSGLVASRQHRRVLWTHNDSGDAARVFAVGRSGRTRAVVSLSGIRPRDIEALTIRPSQRATYLYLADIGDNRLRRSEITIYKFREPATLTSRSVTPTRWRLRYPDGPHDAEAFLYDRQSGRYYVATKSAEGGRIYRVPRRPSSSSVMTMTAVGRVPERITDGTFLPDGRMVLRTHGRAYISNGPGTSITRTVPLPSQPQGESIAASRSSSSFFVGSEGTDSAVYRVTQ